MTSNSRTYLLRPSVAAVRGAFIALAIVPMLHATGARAADPAVDALVKPTNTIEAGIGNVSEDSAKFGEYNGLFNKGIYGIFNFNFRGGAPYDSDDATRFRITGTDLGLETRNVAVEFGQQGRFRLNLMYDELHRARSDMYRTPYLGTGTNNLTLPSNWLKPLVPQVSATTGNYRGLDPVTGLAPALVSGVVTPATAAQQAIVNNIIANDIPAFHEYDLGTTRKAIDGGVSYFVTPQWEFRASVRHEDKDGTKPMAMLSLASGTTSTVLPDLIDQATDQYNASINYKGDKAFLTAAYYGSVFRNKVSSMSWQNPFDPTIVSTMSAAPSNEYHQWSLTGGYQFTPTTRLSMVGAYARTTQNDSFLNDAGTLPLGLPASSPDAKIITTSFNAKLSSKPVKGLNLSAGYKYDDRDNQTSVHTFEFYDAGEAKTGASAFNTALGQPAGTLGSNINIYANRPYSKKLNQANLDADYALGNRQYLKGGYEYQQIERTCPGSWIECADAKETRENTLRAEWGGTPTETLSARLSYAYSSRRVDYNENAWLALVPMANVIPSGGATTSVYTFLTQTGLGGFGPIAPWVALQPGDLGIFFPNNSALPQALYGSRNDIHELPGMRRFHMADRDRNKARGSATWQASEQLSLDSSIEYINDDYKSSIDGLTKTENWAFNVDGTFAINEALSANAFYTYEDLRAKSAGLSYSAGGISNTAFVGVAANTVVSGGCFSTVTDKNANAKIDPCLNWTRDSHDKVDTLGAGFNYKGLMSGKLDLRGDLVYTQAKTNIAMGGGTYANNPYAVAGQPAVAVAVYYIPAQDMPTVTSKTVEFRLGGKYIVDKASSVNAMVGYQRLRVTDFAYDGMQFGSLAGIIPTLEKAPDYNVYVVGLSYSYRWQ